MKPLTKQQILAKMGEGFELGYSAGTGRDKPHAWLQKRLCCGGESFTCHLASFYALRESRAIESYKLNGDSFWLTRYRLTDAQNSG